MDRLDPLRRALLNAIAVAEELGEHDTAKHLRLYVPLEYGQRIADDFPDWTPPPR